MGNTVKPSTSLLPMEDIVSVLKNKYNFSLQDDTAIDTQKVASTASALIAIAATNDAGALIKDRETIKNALYLNDVAASDYMTKQDGIKIEDFGENVSKVFANELTALKDEFYQLKGELTRQGMVTESGIYSGFQDFFRSGDKKYHYKSLGGVQDIALNELSITKLTPSLGEVIKAGDWFVVKNTVQNYDTIVKATDVTAGVVTFQDANGLGIPTSRFDPLDKIELVKVLGEYNAGSFSFSKLVDYALTNKEKYTMLNDDSNPQMQSITVSNSGYAVGFNVPSAVGGALNKLSVVARSSGSPGALTCYVMEDTESNRLLIKNIETEPIGPTNKVLAKSKPVPATKAALPSPVQIDFEFQNTVDGSYPILAGNKRYLFLIVAEAANVGGDKWEIQFSKNIYDNSNTDVQSNNKSYTYVAGSGLTEVLTIGDMIFILATIEVKSNDEQPYSKGLYTTEEFGIPHSDGISRARLTMRINREGYFVTENNVLCSNGGAFGIGFDPAKTNGQLAGDLGFRSGDIIAIGTDFRKITTDCKSMQLTVEKGISIEAAKPVYNIGYKAYIRAYKKVWNPTTLAFDISNKQLIEMPLVCIMPDRNKISSAYSDRLIFECEFRDVTTQLPLDVNMFELQILWNTNNADNIVTGNHDLIGRIYDLTLSLDKTL